MRRTALDVLGGRHWEDSHERIIGCRRRHVEDWLVEVRRLKPAQKAKHRARPRGRSESAPKSGPGTWHRPNPAPLNLPYYAECILVQQSVLGGELMASARAEKTWADGSPSLPAKPTCKLRCAVKGSCRNRREDLRLSLVSAARGQTRETLP